MATITASSSASLVARASLVQSRRVGVSSSPVLGLPAITKKGGKVTCSMENNKASTQESTTNKGMMGASMLAAAAATAMSSPAMALVDERMSTEGTGLPFGLSNNLLGWILLGVFGLIWALYFVYVSGLEEDEESGLSL
ncbi:photosystem II reaction center W protein, chloroplastic-like [Chenopodium quinoa]|uniref:photosystem II reaction center W protein, chloroplastic-like n=1 Tax=Chenopodium quinoa TaxID=63459 RepID=UPI000B77BB83|nr:photosystem II reaction center W protein, chloroplastic-like [Chenopodium quinoa]